MLINVITENKYHRTTQELKEVLQDNNVIDWLENPLQLNNLEGKYYELEDIAKCFPTNSSETLKVVHLNMHNLADKFSKLPSLSTRLQEILYSFM